MLRGVPVGNLGGPLAAAGREGMQSGFVKTSEPMFKESHGHGTIQKHGSWTEVMKREEKLKNSPTEGWIWRPVLCHTWLLFL
jgi:hypothetical protein